MKHMKKFMALFAALALVMAMAVPAFADDPTYSITISNGSGTYKAYQIFSGTLNSDGQLGNIEWGTGVDSTKIATYGKTAKEAAESLTDTSAAEAFATTIANYLSDTYTLSSGNSFTGLTAGYYLIMNDTVASGEAYTKFILAVTTNQTVNAKVDVPSFEKKVKDINDSTETSYTDWKDSADHDIGDNVPFLLKGKIANNFASYKNAYTFIFHDKQSAGLTFKPETVVVTVDTTDNDTVTLTKDVDYTITTSGLTDGDTFEITVNDLKSLPNGKTAKAGGYVYVEYESQLNQNAVIGSTGNPNEAHLEFSNNPNGTGTGETPKDEVIVFTYKVDADKTNNLDQPLAGAAFELFKKDTSNNWVSVGVVNATKTTDTEGHVTYTLLDDHVTHFEWRGIDDGTYMIREVITPAGYNTIPDQVFNVTATHNDGDTPSFGTLSGNEETGSVIAFTPDVSAGSLSTTIVNNAGTTLPGTGGIGTTIFYVVGGGLMVAAAVLLVAKKRMENK